MGYETVITQLEAYDLVVSRGYGGSISARCPSHDDNRASLSVGEADDGSALLYCHAGCDITEIVEALNLTMSDLFHGKDEGSAVVATYVYVDEEGQPLSRVLRTMPKGFYQERWEDGEWKSGLRDVRRVLYHLDDLMAQPDGATVYVVEGEKDADNLRAAGVVATTMLGGAGKWRDEYTAVLKRFNVIVVPDADDPGRLSANRIRTALDGVAESVRVLVPAAGKDVTDHLLAGFTVDELIPEDDGLDEFGPLDWEKYEVEETDWLYEPYIPKSGRVLAFGPAGSLKSLWAMWVAAKLAKEGKKVAYFSLEMLPSATASRLRQLNPPKENFLVFTRDLKLGSESHTNKLIAGLAGFDLIVIDSWSAARASAGRESNEAIAALDTEAFLPLIKHTGAALLILDNTGHAMFTDAGKVKPDWARGASAKGDKMEVTLWFDRPFEDNNYQTRVTVKKMRLDYPIPKPITIQTPTDRIEFYHVVDGRMDQPVWKAMQVLETSVPAVAVNPTLDGTPTVGDAEEEDMTDFQRRALARLKDRYGQMESV